MLLITKELAEAVLECHSTTDGYYEWCSHCDARAENYEDIKHLPNCIVTRAKLLLEQEWGIKPTESEDL